MRVRPRIAGYSSRWMRQTQSSARAACCAVGAGVQLAPLLGQAVGPLHLGIARGLARRDSRSVRPPARSATTPARRASRGACPRDSRCRPARGRAGPSGRRRGGTSPGSPRPGRVPSGGGGETSAARMAPEASSVTVSQQMCWPVAKGTFSTASTCQTSWGWAAWGTDARRRRGGGAGDGRRPGRRRVGGSGPRGGGARAAWLAELEPDQARPPRRGGRGSELAGDAEQLPGGRRDRTTQAAIVGGQQPGQAVAAVQPPDLPDRAVGDRAARPRSGSRGCPADDVARSPGGEGRERARHGSRLLNQGGDQSLTDSLCYPCR